MATVSLVAARKGGAYYVHDGLVVIGFAGNGEDGSNWWCKDYDQVKCSVARVPPSGASLSHMCSGGRLDGVYG